VLFRVSFIFLLATFLSFPLLTSLPLLFVLSLNLSLPNHSSSHISFYPYFPSLHTALHSAFLLCAVPTLQPTQLSIHSVCNSTLQPTQLSIHSVCNSTLQPTQLSIHSVCNSTLQPTQLSIHSVCNSILQPTQLSIHSVCNSTLQPTQLSIQSICNSTMFDPRRWDRQFVPKRRQETTILRCVKTQNKADLIFCAAEA
jgi:hypothetical protein